MGFITPKVKVPAAPAAPEPDPVPQTEEVENDVFTDMSARRKRRKGLEATLLSDPSSASGTAKGTTAEKTSASTPAPSASNPGIAADRKTLG